MADKTSLEWWRKARFGLFIHWGPSSLGGREISWSRIGLRPMVDGRLKWRIPAWIPAVEYDAFPREFNPTAFDAVAWVKLAQAAGMKYLVFTTKHHDGFCLFNSRLTDYKLAGRDIVAELATACHQHGLRLGFYFSQPDWHHSDCAGPKHRQRFIPFFHGQIRELCTRYGKVDIIWFDGLGGTREEFASDKLFRMIRQLQPGILINDRCRLAGDFDTPEQRIGEFQTNRPWESCITIGDQWSWKPNDQIKSLKECLQTLIQCAGGDGNLLFNVGPMPTGQIEPLQVRRLKEMGRWLKKNGESIYDTRGGPFKPGAWGASTFRGNTVYLHLFESSVSLPAIPARIVSSTMRVVQTRQHLKISVPKSQRDDIATVVVLKLDKPAATVKPRKVFPARR